MTRKNVSVMLVALVLSTTWAAGSASPSSSPTGCQSRPPSGPRTPPKPGRARAARATMVSNSRRPARRRNSSAPS